MNSLEGDAGIEASFSQTEKSAHRHETAVVLNQAHDRGHDSPSNHDGRNPDRRAQDLHHEIGGDFSGNVKREEDGQGIL